MDGGGTVPWTEPVEPSREQRPGATQEAKTECTRATRGAEYGADAAIEQKGNF